MNPDLQPILDAYDPDLFRQRGHQLVDLLADHLAEQVTGQDPVVLPWQTPDQAFAKLRDLIQQPVPNLFEKTLADCIRIHHPRYAGHQITPPVPIAALAGLLTDTVNNGMGVFEMGTIAVAMERYVVQTVARQFGMGPEADGVLTSGGSLANLTALLAARQIQSGTDVWKNGQSEKFAVMVSDQSHYCVDRAARILGWGQDGVIRVPVDKQFRMRTDLLPSYLEQCRQSGRRAIGVVGSACSTATGSFDHLPAIADFCEQHGLWFHVDGAHGAAVAFSNQHRQLVQGIERADSVVLDFHKLLLTPAVASAVIFRDGRNGYRAFDQDAQYLWSDPQSQQWYELAKRTFECTKTMYSFKVFSILAAHGTELFEAHIDRLHALARGFAEYVSDQPDFEIALSPQTNIVCFRCIRSDGNESGDLNQLNARIRDQVIREGRHYLVQTTLGNDLWLRTTIANPLTKAADLVDLIARLRHFANNPADSKG